MYPTELLWQAAGQPSVPGLLDAAQYAALKRKPASYPPSGPCYLCGREIDGAAQPTSARFDDSTWTAHGTACAIDSEWLCPACAFSLSEYVDMPAVYPKRFKIRCQTHHVAGSRWTVLGLSDKLAMREHLLCPPPDPWLLAICDSPLSAGHNLYLTQVNSPHERAWRVMLGRVSVAGSPDDLAYVLYYVETLYAAEAWADVEAQILATGYIGSPQFANPITAAVVRSMGWRNLCASEQPWVERAQFMRMYDQRMQRSANLQRLLPQAAEFAAQRQPGLRQISDTVRAALPQWTSLDHP